MWRFSRDAADPGHERGLMEDEFVRLDHLESMLALPLGRVALADTGRTSLDPRQVLDAIVSANLRLGRIYVMFSGGRDSSAVLALATHHARRLGMNDPIPVTALYPEAPESQETEFQELVIRHLGLQERIAVTIRHEQRFLGETAVRALRRHGLLWPASLQLHGALFAPLDPGVLLTGEGGDEAFDPRRITPLHVLRRRRGLPSRALVRQAATALVPSPVRRVMDYRRHLGAEGLDWLRPPARRLYARAVAELESAPLRWDSETLGLLTRRTTAVALHNFDAQAREFALAPAHPLADPRFRYALAAAGGAWGYAGRTDMMRRLFADLLPDEILARRSKAAFNISRWGRREREFARSWDGSGVDHELVDPEALRHAWLSDRPTSVAGFYLHLAWLAQEELDVHGRPAAA